MNLIRKAGQFIVAATLFSVMGVVQATPLIDFTADNSAFIWYGNSAGCELGCTLGYDFAISSSVTIDGLGVFDAGSNGLNNTHEIALWTFGGTLLASTSVGPGATASDPSASGAGDWLYSDISSLTLGVGTYIVGALYEVGDTDHVAFNASGIFSNDPGASFIDSQWINTGVLQLPTNSPGATDRYFGPTMRIAEAAVPEPATLALMGLGLVGLGLSRRRGK